MSTGVYCVRCGREMKLEEVSCDCQYVIVIPAKFAEGKTVVVQHCTKTETDEECNWCSPKYHCKLFVDSLPKISQ